MPDLYKRLLDLYNDASFLVLCFLLVASVICCIKLKFVHIFGIPKALSILIGSATKSAASNNTSEPKKLSSFAALAAVIGGNLGVGNIAGVAVALTSGGPGSVFWMCVMIIFVPILKYASCVIAVHNRAINRDPKINDSYIGGTMQCLDLAASRCEGLKSRLLKMMSCLYVLALIMGAITIGNFVQVNSVAISCASIGIPKIAIGIAMAVILYGVLNGGMAHFAKISSALVPWMALLYMGACLTIIITHRHQLPAVFWEIINSAFQTDAYSGATIWVAFNVGSLKSILATDCGLGLESIIHSHVKNDEQKDFAVGQGLVSALSPMVVMLFVLMTTFTFMTTGVWKSVNLNNTSMSVEAFNVGMGSEVIGPYIVSVILFFFAFTTCLTWVFCADKAVLCATKNEKYAFYWKRVFVLLIPMGSIMSVPFVWHLADMIIPLIVLPNTISVMYFFRDAMSLTRKSKV